MATKNRDQAVFLIDKAREEPYRFDFFRLVQVLETLRPDREPIGYDGPYIAETIHFEEDISRSFPPGDVIAVSGLDTNDYLDRSIGVRQTFFGFLGQGVLPEHYTEDVVQDLRNGKFGRKSPRKDFLAIFQHRLLSLFYRAWRKYDYLSSYTAARARTWSGEGEKPFDEISTKVFALAGFGSRSIREANGIDPDFLLYNSGAFASQSRNGLMLEKMLRNHFGVPVNVIPFIGKWLYLETQDRSRIGRYKGKNQRIGESLIVGQKVWDMQSLIRIRIGPLSFDEFRSFLPDQPSFLELSRIVRAYIGSDNDFQIQLVLKAKETPCFRLSRTGVTRIGYTSWVGKLPRVLDADDPLFDSRN
ncbi:type VI secretion system baseplate subunit TssG [bacterium]|nr:type VI secretion system baseplate subunit TssG [bacterium]